MALIDQLIDQYGNSTNNPYATQQPQPVAFTPSQSTPSIPISSLIDLLGRQSNNPYASMAKATATAAPAQQQGLSANPEIVPISDAEANAALSQQGVPSPDATRIAAMQSQAVQQQPTQAPQPQQQAQQATPGDQQMPTVAVQNPPVASVDATPGFPSPSDYNADGSQASGGGLLGALAGAGQQAANDPVAAKGLLSQLGDYASGIGSKLKNMSPAASQALIATGMTMLANNDGTHNLAQLVGQGGIAGINQYQTVTQNTIGNQLARQKLAQEYAEKQATNATANYNAETERFKAANAPTTVEAGRGIVTPAMIASGQSPQMLTGPGGALPVARTAEITDGQGNVFTQGMDMWGKPVGAPVPKTLAYTGPLPDAQQKVVNDANTTANQSAMNIQKLQGFMKQLTPTMPDPNDPTKTIPNPDYVPVTGGVAATVQNELNKLTGSQSESQRLRSQIQQEVQLANAQGFKAGIGGRLTNMDVGILQRGMPPDNANGSALLNYLSAYSHLKEDQATRDSMTAQYVNVNRGDMGPLHKAVTINGVEYPQGTTMQQVLSRQAQAQSGNSGGGQSGSAAQAQGIIAKAQAAARSGDTSAQAALKQRGLSW